MNWNVSYYDIKNGIISIHTILDRTEQEAEKEAIADMPSNCEDWTMMQVDLNL